MTKRPKKPSKKSKSDKSIQNLKPFEPGKSGNPSGRSKTPEDILQARKLTNQDVERSIHAMLQMTKEELAAVTKRPDTKNLEHLLASILTKGMKGDVFRASFILDRAGARLAPVPIQINIAKEIEGIPNSELAELGKQAILILEASHKPISSGVIDE